MQSGVEEKGQAGFMYLEIINGEMAFIAMGLYKITLGRTGLRRVPRTESWAFRYLEARRRTL